MYLFNHGFLGGTTKGTTWRDELMAEGEALGIARDHWRDPRCPKGTPYDAVWAAKEDAWKADENSFVLINICPGAVKPELYEVDPEQAVKESELVGLMSVHEADVFSMVFPHRSVVVYATDLFTPRARRRLGLVRDSLRRYAPEAAIFDGLDEAKTWMFKRLPRTAPKE